MKMKIGCGFSSLFGTDGSVTQSGFAIQQGARRCGSTGRRANLTIGTTRIGCVRACIRLGARRGDIRLTGRGCTIVRSHCGGSVTLVASVLSTDGSGLRTRLRLMGTQVGVIFGFCGLLCVSKAVWGRSS